MNKVIIASVALVVLAITVVGVHANDQLTARNRQVGAIYANDCVGADNELGIVVEVANATGQLPDGQRLNGDQAGQTRSACSPQ